MRPSGPFLSKRQFEANVEEFEIRKRNAEIKKQKAKYKWCLQAIPRLIKDASYNGGTLSGNQLGYWTHVPWKSSASVECGKIKECVALLRGHVEIGFDFDFLCYECCCRDCAVTITAKDEEEL